MPLLLVAMHLATGSFLLLHAHVRPAEHRFLHKRIALDSTTLRSGVSGADRSKEEASLAIPWCLGGGDETKKRRSRYNKRCRKRCMAVC